MPPHSASRIPGRHRGEVTWEGSLAFVFLWHLAPGGGCLQTFTVSKKHGRVSENSSIPPGRASLRCLQPARRARRLKRGVLRAMTNQRFCLASVLEPSAPSPRCGQRRPRFFPGVTEQGAASGSARRSLHVSGCAVPSAGLWESLAPGKRQSSRSWGAGRAGGGELKWQGASGRNWDRELFQPGCSRVLLGFWACVLLPAALLWSCLPVASGPPSLEGAVLVPDLPFQAAPGQLYPTALCTPAGAARCLQARSVSVEIQGCWTSCFCSLFLIKGKLNVLESLICLRVVCLLFIRSRLLSISHLFLSTKLLELH